MAKILRNMGGQLVEIELTEDEILLISKEHEQELATEDVAQYLQTEWDGRSLSEKERMDCILDYIKYCENSTLCEKECALHDIVSERIRKESE